MLILQERTPQQRWRRGPRIHQSSKLFQAIPCFLLISSFPRLPHLPSLHPHPTRSTRSPCGTCSTCALHVALGGEEVQGSPAAFPHQTVLRFLSSELPPSPVKYLVLLGSEAKTSRGFWGARSFVPPRKPRSGRRQRHDVAYYHIAPNPKVQKRENPSSSFLFQNVWHHFGSSIFVRFRPTRARWNKRPPRS